MLASLFVFHRRTEALSRPSPPEVNCCTCGGAGASCASNEGVCTSALRLADPGAPPRFFWTAAQPGTFDMVKHIRSGGFQQPSVGIRYGQTENVRQNCPKKKRGKKKIPLRAPGKVVGMDPALRATQSQSELMIAQTSTPAIPPHNPADSSLQPAAGLAAPGWRRQRVTRGGAAC